MAKWFANLYDFVMAPLEKKGIARIRKRIVSGIDGKVLEIGSGTGANFQYYNSERVSEIDALEPNPHMLQHARLKAAEIVIPVKFHLGVAESLPYKDGQFDTIVATLVLCSVDDPHRVFAELKRVCKKGGKIVLFEHVRTESATLAGLQDLLNPAWKRLCDNCHLNRDTGKYLRESGIKVVKEKKYFKGIFVEFVGVNPE